LKPCIRQKAGASDNKDASKGCSIRKSTNEGLKASCARRLTSFVAENPRSFKGTRPVQREKKNSWAREPVPRKKEPKKQWKKSLEKSSIQHSNPRQKGGRSSRGKSRRQAALKKWRLEEWAFKKGLVPPQKKSPIKEGEKPYKGGKEEERSKAEKGFESWPSRGSHQEGGKILISEKTPKGEKLGKELLGGFRSVKEGLRGGEENLAKK